MPGGKQQEQLHLYDLESFIQRKRLTPEKWLASKQITTPEGLEAFLGDPAWVVSPTLEAQLRKALESRIEATKPHPVEPVDLVVEPEQPEAVSDTEDEQATLTKTKGKKTRVSQ